MHFKGQGECGLQGTDSITDHPVKVEMGTSMLQIGIVFQKLEHLGGELLFAATLGVNSDKASDILSYDLSYNGRE